MKRRKRRMNKGLKFVLWLIILVFLSIMILFTPLFNIREITVAGANYYSAEEIKQMSGILPGENGYKKILLSPEAILGLRLFDTETLIEELPYVKEARVTLGFPTSIHIAITERDPTAYIVYLGNYLMVDSEGYVLEVRKEAPEDTLKEIRGIDFTKYTLGKQLEAADIDDVRLADNVIRSINKSDTASDFLLWPLVDWIDIVDAQTVLVSLDNRVIVRFDPSDKLQYTVDFIKEIFFTRISTNQRGTLELLPNMTFSYLPE